MIILTSILTAFFGIEKSAAWWKKEEKKLFEERFLSHRLLEVFSHLEEVDQIKTFFFTANGGKDLIFSYDNGISSDPALSGSVIGRLFVDLQGQLVLVTWPERELWTTGLPSFHREVLLKEVKEIGFSFFHLTYPGEDANEPTGWKQGDYSKGLINLPGAIKLSITMKDEREKIFHFPIPQTLPIIFETQ